MKAFDVLDLHQWMLRSCKTLACAESCTGGLLAHWITKQPGCSSYFLGSFVVYSSALKERVLGVSKEVLAKEGAVGKETAQSMLLGLLTLSQADFGIATTGIAGPDGGSDAKPIGTIWFAFGSLQEQEIGHLELQGSREQIIAQAAHLILEKFYHKLSRNP